jgi:hypothetical protein
MKFPVNVCPLCNKVMKLRQLAKVVNLFECPTQVDELKGKSHYEVEFDSREEIQHIIIFPYSIDTLGNSSKSRIYKAYVTDLGDPIKWKFLKEVSVIRAESEEKLMERLQTLLLFL